MTQDLLRTRLTPTLWQDTGGDLAMTLNNLGSGAGRQGAELNLGAVVAGWWEFIWWVEFATTPVDDEVVQCHIKTGDGTRYTNDDGVGDIAVSALLKLNNVPMVDRILVDEAATNIRMSASKLLYLVTDRILPIMWNATADNLRATNNTSGVLATPVPPQLQDDV